MKIPANKYRVLIVGMGNYIMGDDGAGVHLIKELRNYEWTSDIQLIELGTAPMNHLTEISLSEKVIAVDAIKGGEKPGTVYKLSIDDVTKTTVGNIHGLSLIEAIWMSRSMTGLPRKIIILGIEPADISPGTELSPPVQRGLSQIEEYLKTLTD